MILWMKGSTTVLKWRIKWFCQQHLPEYQHRWTHHCLSLLSWSIPTSGTGNTKFSSEKSAGPALLNTLFLSCPASNLVYLRLILPELLSSLCFLFFLVLFAFFFTLFLSLLWPFIFFTLISSLPLRHCPIFFLPLLVSHNLLTPDQVPVLHHSLASSSHPVLCN